MTATTPSVRAGAGTAGPRPRPRVLVLDPLDPDALAELADEFDVVVRLRPPRGDLLRLVADADAVVVRSGVQLTAEVLRAAPRLRVIARAGAGIDNIDVAEARAAGVRVFTVPGASAAAVAELAIGLVFAVRRQIALADRHVRAARWPKAELVGEELGGHVAGVVGLGRIGLRVAGLARGLGMSVLGTVAAPSAARRVELAGHGVDLVPLADLLARADVVVLAVPLAGPTRHLLGAEQLGVMAPSACLVNVSRAGVVDEAALLVALRDPVTYPDRGAMRSCRLVAPRTLRVQEVPVPTPVGADLLVRVVATGICGSDLAAYRGTHPYKKAPAVLGHELVGVVTALGPEASGAEPGDLVSSAAFCPCGVCPSCRRGEVNLCPDRRSMSTPGWDGSFAEFVVLQPATTFVLPGAVSPRQGVLVEPLAIGRRAMRLAEGRGGTVVVLGAGTIGLSCLLSARRLGFARVVTTDVGPAKAARARAAGADDHLDAAEQDVAVALRGTADVTVVASGHPSVMAEALAVTRPGGLLVVVSYFDGPRSVDLNGMVSAGLTVAFSALATPEDFTDVIRWLAAGDLDPAPLVSHRFPLEDAQEAMALLDSGDPAAGKVVLDVSTTQDRTGGSG